MSQQKTTVGAEEWCALPALGLPALKARIDSGAKTSSLHAFHIRPFEKKGEPWVRFDLHPLQKDRHRTRTCEAPVVDHRHIKSSSGVAEPRYVIATELSLGDTRWEIQLTLANRDSMGYRMLLGREAMRHRLLVDPDHSFLHGEPKEDQLVTHYGAATPTRGPLHLAAIARTNDGPMRRLMEAAREQGHHVTFQPFSDWQLDLQNGHTRLHSKSPLPDHLPPVQGVFFWLEDADLPFATALARHWESQGVRTLPSASALTRTPDRLQRLAHLQKAAIALLPTCFTYGRTPATPLAAPHLLTSWGVGQAPNHHLMQKALPEGFHPTLQSHTPLLRQFQHWPPSDENALATPFSSLLCEKKVLCTLQAGQPLPQRFKLTSTERTLLRQVHKALHLQTSLIHWLRTPNGPRFFDLELFPDLPALEELTGQELCAEWIGSLS